MSAPPPGVSSREGSAGGTAPLPAKLLVGRVGAASIVVRLAGAPAPPRSCSCCCGCCCRVPVSAGASISCTHKMCGGGQ